MVPDEWWLLSVENFGVRTARGDAMSDGIDAMAVIFAIPAHARPTHSGEIDAICDRAARAGWTENDFIEAVTTAIRPTAGTGAAIWTLRKIAGERPPQATRIAPRRGPHQPCGDPTHDPKCEVCRCDRNDPHHHVSVPMPESMRAQIRAMFRPGEPPTTPGGDATTGRSHDPSEAA